MLLLEPILEVCRDHLVSVLSNITNKEKSIRLTNEERVPSYAGEEFINLYGATTGNSYDHLQIERKEFFNFSIGITRRLHGIPTDQTAETIYTYKDALIRRTKSSMARRAYEIITALDGNWDIVNTIRNLSELDNVDMCLMAPLGFISSSPVEEVSSTHFYLEEDEDNQRPVGLFLELKFGGLDTYTNR